MEMDDNRWPIVLLNASILLNIVIIYIRNHLFLLCSINKINKAFVLKIHFVVFDSNQRKKGKRKKGNYVGQSLDYICSAWFISREMHKCHKINK